VAAALLAEQQKISDWLASLGVSECSINTVSSHSFFFRACFQQDIAPFWKSYLLLKSNSALISVIWHWPKGSNTLQLESIAQVTVRALITPRAGCTVSLYFPERMRSLGTEMCVYVCIMFHKMILFFDTAIILLNYLLLFLL